MSNATGQHELEKYAALWEEAQGVQGISLGQDAWRRLKRNRGAVISLIGLVSIALLALLTPMLPLQPPQRVDTERIFAPPTFAAAPAVEAEKVDAHFGIKGGINLLMVKIRLAVFGEWSVPSICGTDELGRDTLARIFWGARVSLAVGIVATLVSLVIGVSYGAVAGYFGGRVDNVMMRIVDMLYSVPFICVVIMLVSILNDKAVKAVLEEYGINQIAIFFIIVGAIYWLTMSRVVRGQVISLKNEQYIEAARTIGASRLRIIFRHLVPNVLSVVIVYLTLTIPSVMLFEAFLSFLGLGVKAPEVSWGLLVNQGFSVITPIKVYWWLVLFPGLALAMTLYALNFLGDGLRDALDPRLKNK